MKRGTLLAAMLAAGAPLHSQEISVLLGGVRAQYADSISGTAGTVSLRLGGSSARAVGILDASVSRFTDGGWVNQGSGYGTLVLTNNRGGLNLAVAGGADGNYIEGGSFSGSGSLGPVLALSQGTLLATIGASIGTVRDIAENSFLTGAANAKARLGLGGGFSVAGGAVAVAGDTIRYVDATLELGFDSYRINTVIAGGARAGDLSDDPWIQGRISFAIAPTALLELAAGSYPRDLVGFDQGLYVSAGLRVNLTRSARAPYTAPPPPPLSVKRADSGRVLLRIHFPTQSESVAIAGDWGNWDALPLTRVAADTWEIAIAIEPGIYRYSLVVGGETWTLPPGVISEPDGFGGQVGLLIVR
ncbi:MAG: glycogen-binding domain-containing protein [Gemmatimonadota bacterium]|nr:MAG: glycogen-binding domain-containing protein [Gemmatimonadota bacterium]